MTEKALHDQHVRNQLASQEGYQEPDPTSGYNEPLAEPEEPDARYLNFINTTEDFLRDVASVRAYYAEDLERPPSSPKLPNFTVLTAELQILHTWAVASEGIAIEILSVRNVPTETVVADDAAPEEVKGSKRNRKKGSSTTSGL